ncbi:hypothetical protein GCM10020000_25530 [Streptomyces olivoverticillatus]
MRGTVGSQTPAGEEIPAARSEESAAPPAKPVPRPVPRPVPAAPAEVTTAIINRVPAPKAPPHTPAAPRSWTQKLMAGGNRRNLAAAGAGAVLAAVLAAVVTLGSASGGSDNKHSDTVKPGQSASEQDGDKGLSADEPSRGGERRTPGARQAPQARPVARRGRRPELPGRHRQRLALRPGQQRPGHAVAHAHGRADARPHALAHQRPHGESDLVRADVGADGLAHQAHRADDHAADPAHGGRQLQLGERPGTGRDPLAGQRQRQHGQRHTGRLTWTEEGARTETYGPLRCAPR